MKRYLLFASFPAIFGVAVVAYVLLTSNTISQQQKAIQEQSSEAKSSIKDGDAVVPTVQEVTQEPTKPQPTTAPTKPISLSVKLESITPSSAANNQSITLKGTGFGNSQGNVIFYNSQGMVSGSPAIDSWNDTEIHTKVYFVKGGQFSLAVRKPNGEESNRVAFVVTAGQPYVGTINGANIGPHVLKRNSQVTISGTEFGLSGSITFEKSGSSITASVNSWSDTQIIFIVPAQTVNTSYDVYIKTSDGRSSSSKYVTISD